MDQLRQILEFELFSYQTFSFTVMNLVTVILIYVIARLIASLVAAIWKRRFKASGIQDEGRKFAIITISKYLIYTLATFLMLGAIGLDVSLLVAGSSVILVGLGFILKNIFIDITSGIIIMFERTVEINDIIDYDGVVARVKYIGIRATKVESRDGIELIIPNSKFTDGKVVNWGHGHHQVRFHVRVPVAYGSDPKVVSETLIHVAQTHPDLAQKSRGCTVWFTDYTDTAMVFELLFWSGRLFPVEATISELRFEIHDALAAKGIRMPVPHRDMQISVSHPGSNPLDDRKR
jgi:small-conductance mechanosensitive channel